MRGKATCTIRSDSNISGIRVGDDETIVLAYADDMTAALSDIPSFKRDCLPFLMSSRNVLS